MKERRRIFQDAGQEGPAADASDPVDRIVGDGGAEEAREHNQRQGRPPIVSEEAASEHHDIPGGWQAEVVQRRAQEDDQITVSEEQARDEFEQTLRRVRHGSDEVQDPIHTGTLYIMGGSA
jgi:hypothetical protein